MGKAVLYEVNHREVNGIVQKLCSVCNDWLDMTDENYYKNTNKIDGYFPYCKKCSTKKASINQQNRKDKVKIYKQQWYQDNREEFDKKVKEYRKENAEWYENFISEYRKREYVKDNYKQYNNNHRNHKITQKQWIVCKEYFNNCCAYCELPINQHYNKYKGKLILTDFHKEHVNHEGANDISNCVPSCKKCNSNKRTIKLVEWYPKQEFYSEERLNKVLKWIEEDYKLIT